MSRVCDRETGTTCKTEMCRYAFAVPGRVQIENRHQAEPERGKPRKSNIMNIKLEKKNKLEG